MTKVHVLGCPNIDTRLFTVRQSDLGTHCILINVVVTRGLSANGMWSTKLTLRSPKCVDASHLGVVLTCTYSAMNQAV